jgi:hypothetical protein
MQEPKETKMNEPKKIDCEIYIAMNEDGGWIVTSDDSEALSTLAENEGGWLARVVKVTVKMTPPVIAEATVDVPDEAGETKEIETEAA